MKFKIKVIEKPVTNGLFDKLTKGKNSPKKCSCQKNLSDIIFVCIMFITF